MTRARTSSRSTWLLRVSFLKRPSPPHRLLAERRALRPDVGHELRRGRLGVERREAPGRGRRDLALLRLRGRRRLVGAGLRAAAADDEEEEQEGRAAEHAYSFILEMFVTDETRSVPARSMSLLLSV